MQIERYYIGSSEGFLWQHCQEQFVDDPITFDAHPMPSRPCGMGRHHNATALLVRTHCHLRTVVEATHQSTFWTAELLIRGKGEPKLDLGSQEQLIVFPPHDKRQSSHIREGGSRSIEPIQSQQHAICGDLIRSEVLLDLGHSPA